MSGLRHVSVLGAEAVAALAPERGGRHVDATYGAGGYSTRLLAEGADFVLGLDRDPDAVSEASPAVAASGGKLIVVQGRFRDLDRLVAANDAAPTAGVVFDLGVSSMQLDRAERGFSFRHDGPLDMRMGRSGLSAADFVNEAPAPDLQKVIGRLGEEPRARRIAQAIVAARTEAPIERTARLAAVVEDAIGRVPGARTHPATRTFQAIRMHVNDELGEIERGLEAAEAVLEPGGRLAVVSFHSLEDRMVKRFLAGRAGRAPNVSRHDPASLRDDAPPPSFRLLFRRPVTPSEAEVIANPRARSAKLRAAERTDAPAFPPSANGRTAA